MYQINPSLKFGEQIFKDVPADDSTSMGEKMLLYWMIRDMKPKIVLETGTHRGLTSLVMAHALYDNGEGHLHTADPFDWGAPGNFSKIPELSEYITYYKEPGRDTVNRLEKIDFVFIDGYHEFDDVVPEIKNLLPGLNTRAVVVFHDCWYGNTDGVNEAMESMGLHSVWLPTKNAIRIYSKHEDRPTGPLW